MVKDPNTLEEWREAIDAAVFCIGLAAAEDYGLVTGPDVDVQRAESIIAAARELGYPVPTLTEVVERAAHRQLPDRVVPSDPQARGREADRTPPPIGGVR